MVLYKFDIVQLTVIILLVALVISVLPFFVLICIFCKPQFEKNKEHRKSSHHKTQQPVLLENNYSIVVKKDTPPNTLITHDVQIPSINNQYVYFNWNEKDLECIDNLFQRIKSIYPNATKLVNVESLNRPCILFNFIPVVSRVDADKLKDESNKWRELAGGNSIVVRVHVESSTSFDDDDNFNSFITSTTPEGKKLVLKAKFKQQEDTSGVNISTSSTLLEADILMKSIEDLIKMLK